MTGEIFRDSNGFGVSYHFVGMIVMVPHGPGLKQNFLCIHGAPISFLASLFMLSLINVPLISGHRRIVAAVNHVMKLIVAAVFDHRNMVLKVQVMDTHAHSAPALALTIALLPAGPKVTGYILNTHRWSGVYHVMP